MQSISLYGPTTATINRQLSASSRVTSIARVVHLHFVCLCRPTRPPISVSVFAFLLALVQIKAVTYSRAARCAAQTWRAGAHRADTAQQGTWRVHFQRAQRVLWDALMRSTLVRLQLRALLLIGNAVRQRRAAAAAAEELHQYHHHHNHLQRHQQHRHRMRNAHTNV